MKQNSNKNIGAILLLGGESSRFKKTTKGNIKKQYIEIDNKPLFIYTLTTFLNLDDISHLFLVIPKSDFNYVLKELKNHNLEKYIENSKLYLVNGGKIRQDSVYNALSSINELKIELDYILIHDAVRPLIDENIINEHINNIKNNDNYRTFITINDISDSLIYLNNEEINYIDREKIKIVQTPQSFNYFDLYEAYKSVKNNQLNIYQTFKDDYSLFKYFFQNSDKKNVLFIKGDILNFKLTSNEELKLLEYIFGNKTYGKK